MTVEIMPGHVHTARCIAAEAGIGLSGEFVEHENPLGSPTDATGYRYTGPQAEIDALRAALRDSEHAPGTSFMTAKTDNEARFVLQFIDTES